MVLIFGRRRHEVVMVKDFIRLFHMGLAGCASGDGDDFSLKQ